MKYSNFPGTNEPVSAIGLGTWVFGGEHWSGADNGDSLAVVEAARAAGVNFIDTAPFYSDGMAEQLIGQAIQGSRDRFFIASKCGIVRENGRIRHDLSAQSVLREVDLSLQRLNCEVIDLYQCHWPDPAVEIERTMDVLRKLQDAGKIRHIGVCNFDLPLLRRAVKSASVRTLQMQYSLLERTVERELLPFCIDNNIGLIAYGALGGGILTGKYQERPQFGKWDARKMFYKYFEGKAFEAARKTVADLQVLGHPPGQAALNWVRAQKGVLTVLAGCRTPAQLKENAAAVEWDFLQN